jgi:xylose isomerase
MRDYQPRPEHKFSFGLWTVGNKGRDPFGEPTRPGFTPVEIVELLGQLGAYGVNFHDNDLVPIDASPGDAKRIVGEFKKALQDNDVIVPMATTNLFTDPAFKDGAFTSNDPKVRAYALQKTMRAIDLGVEVGARIYVFWGGREGAEVDAAKDAAEALKRFRDCLNFLIGYVKDQKYDLRFALEAKPNEPRGDIYLPTTGAMLAFIETLEDPEMVGVNPEVAHEQMAGLNFYHAVAQAWEAGKLWHIDLNDQKLNRYDQDLRFASESIKGAFFLVKFLEDVGYQGPRHFDAHAYRNEDSEGVRDFASGCMRSYLILKEKARKFNEDPEIQGLLKEIRGGESELAPAMARYSRENAEKILSAPLDRQEIARRRLPYERLDQLTFELLMGIR